MALCSLPLLYLVPSHLTTPKPQGESHLSARICTISVPNIPEAMNILGVRVCVCVAGAFTPLFITIFTRIGKCRNWREFICVRDSLSTCHSNHERKPTTKFMSCFLHCTIVMKPHGCHKSETIFPCIPPWYSRLQLHVVLSCHHSFPPQCLHHP